MFYTFFMVIYIDVIFFNHYVINRILLLWLQAFFVCPASRLRKEVILIISAAIQIFEEVWYLQRGQGCLQLVAELITVIIIMQGLYGNVSMRQRLRILFIWLAGNIMLGGLFRFLEEYEIGQRLAAYGKTHSLCFYILLVLFLCIAELLFQLLIRQRQLSSYETSVKLCIRDINICLKGFLDSGNFLQDKATGQAVAVGYYGALRKYLDKEHQYIIDGFFREGCLDYDALVKWNITDLRIMEYESLGAGRKKLPVFVADKICFTMQGREVQRTKQCIMLSDRKLFSGEGYDILLHREL